MPAFALTYARIQCPQLITSATAQVVEIRALAFSRQGAGNRDELVVSVAAYKHAGYLAGLALRPNLQ
jgi:hypothetical protein